MVLRITTRVALFVVGGLSGVLVAPASRLTSRYRPGLGGVRTVHQVATYLFMLAGIVLAISSITLSGSAALDVEPRRLSSRAC